MKISKETLRVLQNFSSINLGLVIDEESSLKTLSPTGSIIAVYDTDEKFPFFSIWDLPKFNGLIEMMGVENCEFEFSDTEQEVTIKSGSRKAKYEYADASTMPVFESIKSSAEYKNPNHTYDFYFDLSEEDIKEIKKANGIFGFSEDLLKISMEDGVGKLELYSSTNETKNNYSIEIDGEGTGEALTKVSDLIMVSGDYKCSVLLNKMIKYQHKEKPLLYYIRTYLENK